MIAIVVIYVIAWLRARARARAASDDVERTLATMLGASVVIVGVHGVVQNLFTEPTYTLAIALLLGMSVAAGSGVPRGARA